MASTKKTIAITGASAGFGAGMARRFAQAGHRLVLIGRRIERLQALADELACEAHPLVLDIRHKEKAFEAFEKLPAPFTNLDVLVNNAGLALGLEPSHQARIEEWETMVDTNIKGLLYCTRAALPNMVEQGHGHIIHIGSVAASYPYPGGNTYGATKAFVAQFTRNLRADLVDKNIRVTNIEPGLSETEFSIVRFRGDTDKAKQVYAGVSPLTAEDIAHCVAFAVDCPPHVNINRLEVMPTAQAAGPLRIARKSS